MVLHPANAINLYNRLRLLVHNTFITLAAVFSDSQGKKYQRWKNLGRVEKKWTWIENLTEFERFGMISKQYFRKECNGKVM